MKLALFASLVASAAAFAPVAQQSTSSALNMALVGWKATSPYKDELGVQAPLGFFDPMGLLEDAPQERFDHLRTVELKHGRVCMLAVAGYLTTAAGIRVPGYISTSQNVKFADIPSGLDAFPAVPAAGLLQLAFFILILEIGMNDYAGTAEFIGDFRNNKHVDFGWDRLDAKTKLRKRAIELNNGRAAMMGITGLVTHELMGNLDAILPGK